MHDSRSLSSKQGKICLPEKPPAASCELQLLHSRSFLLEGHHLSDRQSSGAHPKHSEIQEARRPRRAASASAAQHNSDLHVSIRATVQHEQVRLSILDESVVINRVMNLLFVRSFVLRRAHFEVIEIELKTFCCNNLELSSNSFFLVPQAAPTFCIASTDRVPVQTGFQF